MAASARQWSTSFPASGPSLDPRSRSRVGGPASSRHARLTNRGGQWYVEDLGSTNGTYLDQQRVQGPLLINPGQPIRIGQTALELRS